MQSRDRGAETNLGVTDASGGAGEGESTRPQRPAVAETGDCVVQLVPGLEQVVVAVAPTAAEYRPDAVTPLERPRLEPRIAADPAPDEHRRRHVAGDVDRSRDESPAPAQAERRVGNTLSNEPLALDQPVVAHLRTVVARVVAAAVRFGSYGAKLMAVRGRLAATLIVLAGLAMFVGACGLDEEHTTAISVSGGSSASLPTVDLDRAPVADARDPAVRAGAVADYVACEHGVTQGGWTLDFGPPPAGAGPDDAVARFVESDLFAIPRAEYTAAGRAEARRLYIHSVSGEPRVAIVVVDLGTSPDPGYGDDDGWIVETFATCDPAEFDPQGDEVLPFEIWLNAEGDRVPTTKVMSAPGPEHCGWQSATFLSIDGTGYVADPKGVLDIEMAGFDEDAVLPPDAVDTGYHRNGRRLWVSADRTIVYIVTDDRVEAWPSPPTNFGCG